MLDWHDDDLHRFPAVVRFVSNPYGSSKGLLLEWLQSRVDCSPIGKGLQFGTFGLVELTVILRPKDSNDSASQQKITPGPYGL